MNNLGSRIISLLMYIHSELEELKKVYRKTLQAANLDEAEIASLPRSGTAYRHSMVNMPKLVDAPASPGVRVVAKVRRHRHTHTHTLSLGWFDLS